MQNKNKGKTILSIISLAAAVLMFMLTDWFFYLRGFGFGFVLELICLLGSIALIILSILALFRFTDKTARTVGKITVIAFVVMLAVRWILQIYYGSHYYEFVFMVDNMAKPTVWLAISIGLLVAFFMFNAKFPADGACATVENPTIIPITGNAPAPIIPVTGNAPAPVVPMAKKADEAENAEAAVDEAKPE